MTLNAKNPYQNRVVIIGAGIGGLAAAVRLAHAGVAVTVVEANAGPGGKMRRMPSPMGPVDAGPTVLTMRPVFEELFRAAGTILEDHLTLLPQSTLARHWWRDGSSLDLFADADASAAAIAQFAGKRAEAQFMRFHRATSQTFAAFDAPMMCASRPQFLALLKNSLRHPRLWPLLLPGVTLARALAFQFDDPRLRQLFGRYATYVGGSPYRVPAVLGLIWQAEAKGVWAVAGGMHALAKALEALAIKGGAEFRYGTRAARIHQHWGRVDRVVLQDGSSIVADRIVFNGDPAALTAALMGSDLDRVIPVNATAPRSLSAHVWAFAATPTIPTNRHPMIHHNVFFGDDPAREFGPLSQGKQAVDPSVYICAQDRTGPTQPQGKERFEIIVNAPAQLPGTSMGDSQDEESQCRDLMVRQLQRHGLNFDPLPAGQTSPAQFAKMFPGSQGAIYGRSPEGLLAAFRRPSARTRLPGLYLAGGGAHPGAGVPMAALSGKHAAEAILQDLTLASASGPMATHGGISTELAMTARGPSPSSGS